MKGESVRAMGVPTRGIARRRNGSAYRISFSGCSQEIPPLQQLCAWQRERGREGERERELVCVCV